MDIVTILRKIFRVSHWNFSDRLNQNLHRLRYLVAAVIFCLALPSFIQGTASLADVGNIVLLRQPFTPYTLLLEPLQPLILPWRPPFGSFLEFVGLNLTFPYVGEILGYVSPRVFAFVLSYFFVVLLLGVSFKVRRFWCRFCPTGISISAVNRFKWFGWLPLLHLNKVNEKCTKCGICKRVCPLQVVEVYESKGGSIKTSMCTLCLRCAEMCPQKECLNLKLGEKTLFSSRNWLESKS